MKQNLLLLFVITFLSGTVTAQFPKGSMFIGGQISGGKSENTGMDQSHFSITPAIGSAIKQNLFLGADLTYGKTRYKNTVGPESKGEGYGAGIFLRQYIPISKRFFFFAQGRAGYFHERNKNTSGTFLTTSTIRGGSLTLYPGISFALGKILHIETGFNNLAVVSYSSSTSKQTGFPDQKSTNFAFSTSVGATNLNFALRIIIPK